MILFNSMGKVKQPFKSRQENHVKLFSCGPSVYQKPHIGNYRTFCYEDLVCRYLEYLGYKVEHTVNFTDIEDKSVSEAVRLGHDVYAQTKPAEEAYLAEMALLRCQKPTYLPKSSTSVNEAIELIGILLKKGIAYNDNGNIFFQPLKVKHFGKLFGLDLSQWPKKHRRFNRDTYPGNYWNKGDFILWHQADEDSLKANAAWNSPWGIGRPSWNIQDPAMVKQTLGLAIDINCGGIDNIIRHHDYNIAVIEAVSEQPYANYYMHGEHLLVDGKKMSKSKGTVIYPQELTMKGYTGSDIRFFLLAMKHYRKKLNYTDAIFQSAALRRQRIVSLWQQLLITTSPTAKPLHNTLKIVFEEAMNDDFNIAQAINSIETLITTATATHPDEYTQLVDLWTRIDNVLQCF